jgi:hypothetical protein
MTNPTMRGCERFLVAAQSFVTAAALMPGHTGVGFSARSIGHQSANQEKAEHDKDEAEPV